MKKQPKDTHISVRFSPDIDLDALRQIAKRNRRSLNSEINIAVQEYIRREQQTHAGES